MKRAGQGWLSTVGMTALLAAGCSSVTPREPVQLTDQNVILVTLDGVRWQEVFHGTDSRLQPGEQTPIFKHLGGELAKQGVLYGDKERGDRIEVANPALNSLPGYQSIMAGAVQPCRTNACGRIGVETLQERLVRQGELNVRDVATIASWSKIANAAEHVSGTTFVNAGLEPLDDHESDPELAELNRAQAADTPPWGHARADKYTFAQAKRYLSKHHPRFMHLALNDSDEWGHRGSYPNYVATLRQYDAWVKELADLLDSMGEYGRNTTLIVTTDHGRGDGGEWTEHGSGWPASRAIWFYARNQRTLQGRTPATAAPRRDFTHLDLRPTIETLLGLPLREEPGHPISEVSGEPLGPSVVLRRNPRLDQN